MLINRIFTNADIIRIVSIAYQFYGENIKVIIQDISIPQDGVHPIAGYEYVFLLHKILLDTYIISILCQTIKTMPKPMLNERIMHNLLRDICYLVRLLE